MRSVRRWNEFLLEMETSAHFGRPAATGKALAIFKHVSKRPLFVEMNLEGSTGAEHCRSLVRQLPPSGTLRAKKLPRRSSRQQKLTFVYRKVTWDGKNVHRAIHLRGLPATLTG